MIYHINILSVFFMFLCPANNNKKIFSVMKKMYIFLISALMLIGNFKAMAENNSENKTQMNVATFNLRQDNPNDGDDAWPHRIQKVQGLIMYHDFDIFGTQEGFKHQLDNILELKGYAYIGHGRDDGEEAGEHSAIFYKKDRFEVLDKGDFWFSETPNTPGKGWDATCCNRICSWGKFKDKENGKVFYFFNVHYDHQGKVARRESSHLLLKKIKEIATSGTTIFVTGDFNAVPTDEPIKIIAADGLLSDSHEICKTPRYGTEGTTNSFKLEASMKNRIDYIWVTKDVTVEKYAVLNDMQYGHFPSDHFPVVVKVEF